MPTDRRCEHCGKALPAGARPQRRFCSSACRGRAWDAANPRADRDGPVYWGRHIPAHYHVRGASRFLIGHRDSEPWFGASCPPECPGLPDGETYAPREAYYRDLTRPGVVGAASRR